MDGRCQLAVHLDLVLAPGAARLSHLAKCLRDSVGTLPEMPIHPSRSVLLFIVVVY